VLHNGLQALTDDANSLLKSLELSDILGALNIESLLILSLGFKLPPHFIEVFELQQEELIHEEAHIGECVSGDAAGALGEHADLLNHLGQVLGFLGEHIGDISNEDLAELLHHLLLLLSLLVC
jgi:hypothetical protein